MNLTYHYLCSHNGGSACVRKTQFGLEAARLIEMGVPIF